MSGKDTPPRGLRRIWVLASLRLGHRSTGYAPSPRLARTQMRRNKCIAISEDTTLAVRANLHW